MRGGRHFILVLILLAHAFDVRAERAFPELENQTEEAQLLFQALERLPDSMKNSSILDGDSMKAVKTSNELMGKLLQDPDYPELEKSRGPLQELRLIPGNQKKIVLQETWSTMAARWKGIDDLAKNISKLKAELGAGTADGFLTGLINGLSPERRQEVWKLSPQEKLAILAKELPEDLKGSGFKTSEALAHTTLKADLLSLYEKKRRAEENLVSILEIQSFISSLPEDKRPRASDSISQWVQEKAESLLAESDMRKWRDNQRTRLREHLGAKYPAKLFRETEEKVSVLTAPLILKEVPPWLGIFRGYVGGDCATSGSAGYALSPKERIFFIYDEQGKVKGYLAGTVVTRKPATPALYVHTINGKRVNEKEVAPILDALSAVKKELGVEEILLPPPFIIDQNVNYSELKVAMRGLLSQKIAQAELDDYELRRKYIDKTASHDYDRARPSLPTHLYQAKSLESTGLRLEAKDTENSYVAKPASPALAASMAIPITDEALYSAILGAAGIKPEFHKRFVNDVKNSSKLSADKFLQSLHDSLANMGIARPEDREKALEHAGSYLDEGWFGASDHADVAYRPRSIQILLEKVKNDKTSFPGAQIDDAIYLDPTFHEKLGELAAQDHDISKLGDVASFPEKERTSKLINSLLLDVGKADPKAQVGRLMLARYLDSALTIEFIKKNTDALCSDLSAQSLAYMGKWSNGWEDQNWSVDFALAGLKHPSAEIREKVLNILAPTMIFSPFLDQFLGFLLDENIPESHKASLTEWLSQKSSPLSGLRPAFLKIHEEFLKNNGTGIVAMAESLPAFHVGGNSLLPFLVHGDSRVREATLTRVLNFADDDGKFAWLSDAVIQMLSHANPKYRKEISEAIRKHRNFQKPSYLSNNRLAVYLGERLMAEEAPTEIARLEGNVVVNLRHLEPVILYQLKNGSLQTQQAFLGLLKRAGLAIPTSLFPEKLRRWMVSECRLALEAAAQNP
jgi:hypothetical protein